MYKKLSIALCLFVFLDIGYSAIVNQFGGNLLSYSTGVADGSGYRTRIHLFNGDSSVTANFTLVALNSDGFTQTVLQGNTHMLVGSIAPLESFFIDTNQTGAGMGSVFLSLEADSQINAWSQETKNDGLVDVAMVTSPFITKDFMDSQYVFGNLTEDVQIGMRAPFSSSFSPSGLSANATQAFSAAQTWLELYDQDGSLLQSVGTVLPSEGILQASFTDLFTIRDLGPYGLRVGRGTAFFPYLSYDNGTSLDKQLNARLSEIFSPSGLSAATFMDYISESINSEIVINERNERFVFGTVKINTESALTSFGAQVPPNTFTTLSSGDYAAGNEFGTATVDTEETQLVVASTIKSSNARASSSGGTQLRGRLAFHIDSSFAFDTSFADSTLILNNHEYSARRLSMGLLDASGNFLDVQHVTLPTGLTVYNLDDLIGDNTDTTILLLESFLPTEITADIILHKSGTDEEMLDRVVGLPVDGALSVGLFPAVVDLWGTDEQVSCLGASVNVADIVAYMNRGYRCD